MRATLATGRNDKWLNYDAACNRLARHPEANPATAITLYDYQTPRVVVTQSWATNDISDINVETVCWREWERRIWRAQLFPENEEGAQIAPIDFPGDRPDITPATLNTPGKPTLAQLGL